MVPQVVNRRQIVLQLEMEFATTRMDDGIPGFYRRLESNVTEEGMQVTIFGSPVVLFPFIMRRA